MRKVVLAIGATIIAGLLAVILLAKDFDVSISETSAQSAIDKALASGPIKHLGTEINVSKAVLDFRQNDNAQIDLIFDMRGFERSAHVQGDIATGLRYDAPRIYLANIEPGDLNIELDAASDSKVNNYKIIAKDFLERQKKDALSDEAREAMDEVLATDGARMKELSGAAAKMFFQSIPIYKLNDAGIAGSLASLALKDVRFTENEAIVTMSPANAALKLLTFLLFAVLFGLFFYWTYLSPITVNPKSSEDIDPKG